MYQVPLRLPRSPAPRPSAAAPAAGVEPFVLPDARRVRLLALNAALDAVYNALVLFGIQVR